MLSRLPTRPLHSTMMSASSCPTKLNAMLLGFRSSSYHDGIRPPDETHKPTHAQPKAKQSTYQRPSVFMSFLASPRCQNCCLRLQAILGRCSCHHREAWGTARVFWCVRATCSSGSSSESASGQSRRRWVGCKRCHLYLLLPARCSTSHSQLMSGSANSCH